MHTRLTPILLLLALPTAASAAGWEKKAAALLRAGTEEQVGQGADLCLEHDSPKAAKILCRVIARPPRDLIKLRKQYADSIAKKNAPIGLGMKPGRFKLKEPDDGGKGKQLALLINARMSIERHVARVLPKLKAKKTIAWLLKKGLKHKAWRVRAEVALALGQRKHRPARAKLEGLIEDKHPVVRSFALDALALLGDRAAGPAILTALQDPHWQVRLSCVNAVVKLRVLKAAGPLVTALEQEQGRMLSEVHRALQALSGQNLIASPKVWRGWYEDNKAALEGGTYKKPRTNGQTTTRKVENRFFSIAVDTQRVLFVIDYSKSMRRDLVRSKPDGRTRTGEEGQPDLRVPGETRIAEAKEQTLRAMYSLSKDAWLNVVIYHWGVELLAPEMVQANPNNLQVLREALLESKLGLGTNVFDALDRSYDITRTGRFDLNYRSGVDTIFFLSDGAPTSGRMAHKDRILERVAHWNRARKLRIHTILIRDDPPKADGKKKKKKKRRGRAAIRFMRKLAKANGGTFVDVKKLRKQKS